LVTLNTFFAVCSIDLRSWGYDDTNGWIGYARVNGILVRDYTRSPNGWTDHEHVRGFNTILLQPTTCGSYDIRTFDTQAFTAASNALADYLNGLPNGVIIYGLTCDSATTSLTTAARNALLAIGVDVSTLVFRGKLTFVATVGRPQSTVYRIANSGGNNLLMSATAS